MDVRRGSINIAFDAEVFKLVFLGAPKTGKTSLVKRMLHNKFTDSYSSTVEDLYRHECITRGIRYSLEVIDTGGTCEFPAMQTLAIRAADAIVLVYSIDSRDSFEHLESLRDKVLGEKEEDEVTLYVLANKSDLSPHGHRQVAFSEAELKIKIGWDTNFSEVSAKTGEGLEGKLAEIVPPTFLTGITPEASTKRSSGGPELGGGIAASGGMAKRKSITEALSKPFSLMNRGSTSRRRGTTAAVAENCIPKLPEGVEQSAAVAAAAVSSSTIGVKKTNSSRLSIG